MKNVLKTGIKVYNLAYLNFINNIYIKYHYNFFKLRKKYILYPLSIFLSQHFTIVIIIKNYVVGRFHLLLFFTHNNFLKTY